MMIHDVSCNEHSWILEGLLGEQLYLPRTTSPSPVFRIALIGTRTSLVKDKKTEAFAETLIQLRLPLFLVDIRREGTGAMGSWGPNEFTNVIPTFLEEHEAKPYTYWHLPVAAPSTTLLSKWRQSRKESALPEEDIDKAIRQVRAGEEPFVAAWQDWRVFREEYVKHLSSTAVLAGRAFVEAACEKNGVAIFMCAEECLLDFDNASPEAQNEAYCHRYHFVAAVTQKLQAQFPGCQINRFDLPNDRLNGDNLSPPGGKVSDAEQATTIATQIRTLRRGSSRAD